MQFKVKKRLGLGLCIPAVIFLCNPIIAFTDVLPDCIGFLLLYLGLTQAADLNDRLADALSGVRKMLFISIGAYCVQTWIYSGTDEVLDQSMGILERPMLILLASFVMLVLHCCFLLPTYRNLFLGLDALAQHNGGEAVVREKRGKSLCERLASFSSFFVVFMGTVSTLPELSVLTSAEFEKEKLPFDWYPFIRLFRVIALLLGVTVALIWLCKAVRLFLAALRDRVWMERLEERYERDILPNVQMLSLRRHQFSFAVLMLGALFCIHLRMDFQTVIPVIAAAILLCGGTLTLGELATRRLPFFLSCGALALIYPVQKLLSDRYFAQYFSIDASYYDPDAYVDFLILRTVQASEVLLTLLVMGLLLRILWRLVRAHLAEEYAGDAAVSARATARLHRRYSIRITLVFVAYALAAVASVAECWFQLHHPWLWWVSFSLSVVAFCAFCALLFAILEQFRMQFSSAALYKKDE